MDVIDLHCDLLAYLALSPDRTPDDPAPRCSLPQLKRGGVKKQVLAIFSETAPHSLLLGMKQLEIFLSLQAENFIPAFENASSFCIESEPLDTVFKRLEWIYSQITPLYISLTWNGENRFGGGCGSQKGLTDEGKKLLQFLSGRNTAIDFSHTSDALAHDLIDYIDAKKLNFPILASHSNFRSVHDHIRNLPDDIAKEIITRGGVIGLVLYKKFLKSLSQLIDHIEYGYKLGGEYSLCFGADFFHIDDLSAMLTPLGGFFEEMSDASKYPALLKSFPLPEEKIQAIASGNARAFFESKRLKLTSN